MNDETTETRQVTSRAARYLPILGWAPSYKRAWLMGDIIAALSVWALLVPQGIAYASIAKVPAEYGLYTGLAALVGYALFGTSRQMVTGPSATVAALSATVVAPLAVAGSADFVTFTAALALTAGLIYVALGLFRMGWVSYFLSKAVLEGFILGFAIGITIDQSHKLLGVPSVDGSYMQILWGTIKEIPDTSMVTLAVGAASLALLLVLRFTAPKVPRALIVLAGTIIVTTALDLASHGVAVTGTVPTGLPAVAVPSFTTAVIGPLVVGALAVIFVGFSESLASARTMASKHDYDIDTDQEMIAQGAANAASALLGGFVVDGSLSKTSVADSSGQKTQLASLVNAGFILLTILVLAPLFTNLPSAALGAIVIDAMVGLITLEGFSRYRRVDRWDWIFFMAAFLGILFFGILQGVLIGVVLSLLLLIARSSNPAIVQFGYDKGLHVYLPMRSRKDLEVTPGTLVVGIEGPLFFADAARFRDRITQLVKDAEPKPGLLVIDMAAVSISDTDGADILIQVAREMKDRGVRMALAHLEPEIRALYERAGVLEAIGAENVHQTVRDVLEAKS